MASTPLSGGGGIGFADAMRQPLLRSGILFGVATAFILGKGGHEVQPIQSMNSTTTTHLASAPI